MDDTSERLPYYARRTSVEKRSEVGTLRENKLLSRRKERSRSRSVSRQKARSCREAWEFQRPAEKDQKGVGKKKEK